MEEINDSTLETIKPTLDKSGLTQAEANQLMLDYNASPGYFESIKTFTEHHRSDVEFVLSKIDDYSYFRDEHSQNYQAYQELLTTISESIPPSMRGLYPEQMERVAGPSSLPVLLPHIERQAADAVREFKARQQEAGEELEKATIEFVNLFTKFCLVVIPNQTNVVIAGRRYYPKENKSGVFLESYSVNPTERGKTVIFGTLANVRARKQELQEGKTSKERTQVKVGLADIEDWHGFMDGLLKMTKL